MAFSGGGNLSLPSIPTSPRTRDTAVEIGNRNYTDEKRNGIGSPLQSEARTMLTTPATGIGAAASPRSNHLLNLPSIRKKENDVPVDAIMRPAATAGILLKSTSSGSLALGLGGNSIRSAGHVALQGNQLIHQVRFIDESSPNGIISSVSEAISACARSAQGLGLGLGLNIATPRRPGAESPSPSPPPQSYPHSSSGLGGKDRGRRGTAVGTTDNNSKGNNSGSNIFTLKTFENFYSKNAEINPRRLSIGSSLRTPLRNESNGDELRYSPRSNASKNEGRDGNPADEGSGGGGGVEEGAIATSVSAYDPDLILTTIAASDYFLGLKDFFAPPHTDSITAIAVDDRGGRVYTSSYDDTVGVWVPSGRERTETLPHSDWVNAVIVLHLEGVAAVADPTDNALKQKIGADMLSSSISRSMSMSVFGPSPSAQTARALEGLAQRNAPPPPASTSLIVSTTLIISGSEDGNITFWSPEHNNKVIHQISPCHQAPITCLASHEDLLFAGSLRTVFVISITSGTVIRSLSDPSSDVKCLAFVDGSLLCGMDDGRVVAWDIVEGFVIRAINAHVNNTNSSSGGGGSSSSTPPQPPSLIGNSRQQKGTVLNNTMTIPKRRSIQLPGGNNASRRSVGEDSDEQRGGGGGVRCLISATLTPNAARFANEDVLQTAASFQNTFFTAGEDGLIKLWETSTGTCLATFDNNAVAVPHRSLGGRGGMSHSQYSPIRSITYHYRGKELFIFVASANAKISCHAVNSRKSGVIHSAMANAMAIWHDALHVPSSTSPSSSSLAAPSSRQHVVGAVFSSSEPLLVVGDHSGLLQMLPILNPEANVIAGTCTI